MFAGFLPDSSTGTNRLLQIQFLEIIELARSVFQDVGESQECGVVRRQRFLQTSRHLLQPGQMFKGLRQSLLVTQEPRAPRAADTRVVQTGRRAFQASQHLLGLLGILLTQLELFGPEGLPELEEIPLDVVQLRDGLYYRI